mgnify:FL=1
MKNIIKLILASVAVITISFSGYSQSSLRKADAAFDARLYYDAINLYKNAYGSVSKDKKALVLYKMGVASQEINDYKGAEANYQKAIAASFDDPKVYLHLAEVLKNQMRYTDAVTEYGNYKSKG